MSDVADMSDKLIEAFTVAAIAQASRVQHVHCNGRCLFCDEVVAPDLQFCDRDCRDDFEKQKAAMLRAGKKGL